MALKKWMKNTDKMTLSWRFRTTKDAKKALSWMAEELNEARKTEVIKGHTEVKREGKKVSIVCDRKEAMSFWNDTCGSDEKSLFNI